MTQAAGDLAQRLGTVDAIFIGVGSMVGAGVFAVFAPAARAAGGGLLSGWPSPRWSPTATPRSSAQLAAEYPASGGTYVYGRERLGDWWGFLAGWGFVVGKTASCAAMALTFAAYAAPARLGRPVAIAAVLMLAAVNYRGIARTAGLARVIVAIVAASLARGRRDRGRTASRRAQPVRPPASGASRRAPVGRAAVLRVRRVRPHRHPGRGGPRPGADNTTHNAVPWPVPG